VNIGGYPDQDSDPEIFHKYFTRIGQRTML